MWPLLRHGVMLNNMFRKYLKKLILETIEDETKRKKDEEKFLRDRLILSVANCDCICHVKNSHKFANAICTCDCSYISSQLKLTITKY